MHIIYIYKDEVRKLIHDKNILIKQSQKVKSLVKPCGDRTLDK